MGHMMLITGSARGARPQPPPRPVLRSPQGSEPCRQRSLPASLALSAPRDATCRQAGEDIRRLYASPRLRRKRKDLAFDAELGDAPEPEWAADIGQAVLHGSFALTEVVFFHRRSRAALFADLIQNFPRDWFKGWRGLVARLDGIVAPNPGARSEWRASFLDRRAARVAIDQILAWPIERMVIAHGDLPTAESMAFVRGAFTCCSGVPRAAASRGAER